MFPGEVSNTRREGMKQECFILFWAIPLSGFAFWLVMFEGAEKIGMPMVWAILILYYSLVALSAIGMKAGGRFDD